MQLGISFGCPSLASTTHRVPDLIRTETCSEVVCLVSRVANGNPCTIWITMKAPKNARPKRIASFRVDILPNSEVSSEPPDTFVFLLRFLKNLWAAGS